MRSPVRCWRPGERRRNSRFEIVQKLQGEVELECDSDCLGRPGGFSAGRGRGLPARRCFASLCAAPAVPARWRSPDQATTFLQPRIGRRTVFQPIAKIYPAPITLHRTRRYKNRIDHRHVNYPFVSFAAQTLARGP